MRVTKDVDADDGRFITEQRGCSLEDAPMGRFIHVGEGKVTSVPNVFTCGDAARGR